MGQYDIVFKCLFKNKLGPLLVMLQLFVATIAINNLLFVAQYLQVFNSASPGIDAPVMGSILVRPVQVRGAYSQTEKDIALMLNVPHVISAGLMRWQPFSNHATTLLLAKDDKKQAPVIPVKACDTTPDGIKTLGLTLIAGRTFTAVDMNVSDTSNNHLSYNAVIITKSLAEKLEGDANLALNKTYFLSGREVIIVGITQDWMGFTGEGIDGKEYTLFNPSFDGTNTEFRYIIKVDSKTQLKNALEKIIQKLETEYKGLVFLTATELQAELNLFTFSITRFFQLYLFFAFFISVIVVLAVGGQTYLWVQKRRHSIGIRRALGARFSHILYYFTLENLYISISSVLPASVVALLVNNQFVKVMSAGSTEIIQPISFLTIIAVGSALIVLCFLSGLFPAIHAARTSPITATKLT